MQATPLQRCALRTVQQHAVDPKACVVEVAKCVGDEGRGGGLAGRPYGESRRACSPAPPRAGTGSHLVYFERVEMQFGCRSRRALRTGVLLRAPRRPPWQFAFACDVVVQAP